MQQYDKTQLTISGECQATVKITDHVIQVKFVEVKVAEQLRSRKTQFRWSVGLQIFETICTHKHTYHSTTTQLTR